MKWRIASVEAESSRFRNDSASTGLYRFRVDPVGGGLTRSRDGPAARARWPGPSLLCRVIPRRLRLLAGTPRT